MAAASCDGGDNRIILIPFWWEEWAEQMLVIMECVVEQFIIRWRSDMSK